MSTTPAWGAVHLTPDVQRARDERAPIVALESSVLAQGLPAPANGEAARRMCSAIVETGGVPAITAIVRGTPAAGLTAEELTRFLRRDGIAKVAARDLPMAMARGIDAATTVAGSLAICRAAGLTVFATGGIGGVHPEPAYDESADLIELARTPMVVVCAGAKAILDLPATVERLETLSVTIVGMGIDEFPGFFCRNTGLSLTTVARSVDEVARIFSSHRRLGLPGAVLVVQPPPADCALPRHVVDDAVRRAHDEARHAGVRGAAATPFLLAAIDRATHGQSLRTNVGLLESNARLAGAIAGALAGTAAR